MLSNVQLVTFVTCLSFAYSQTITSASLLDSNSINNDLGDLNLYKIVWTGPWTVETTKENISEDNIINISTKNKERYKCVVPDSSFDQLNFDSSAKNSSADEKKSKNPFQILEPLMKSEICSIKSEIFWIYELCHGKHLRQFHSEGPGFTSKITQEYYLGTIQSEQLEMHKENLERETEELERTGFSRPTILVDGQYKPYIMFNMTGGTKCDLTDKNRVSRVIYVCNEGTKHELYSIKEVSTCEYEAIVLSPLLCQHQDFKLDTNTHEIKCYSIDGSPEKPTNLIEADEEGSNRRRGEIAYFQGRTLIIDADLILS